MPLGSSQSPRIAMPLGTFAGVRQEPGPTRDEALDLGPVQVSFGDDQGDADSGIQVTENPDGSIKVDFDPPKPAANDTDDHDANLAEKMDPMELGVIASDLLQGIQADIDSRSEWLSTYEKGIDLLGLKLEDPNTNSQDGTVSKVRHHLLLKAVIRYQSNALAELLPSEGPVKVADDKPASLPPAAIGHNGGPPLDQNEKNRDALAEALEKDFNHYLTTTATEYYPDFDRMLFYVGFGGCAFRKVYRCPLRERPVSESVYAPDLIVSNDITDLQNAARITHRTMMRQSVVKRLQFYGFYREVDLGQPSENLDAVQQKVKETEGLSPSTQLPADHQHEIYECYTERDLKGFEHKKGGKLTGLPLPYVITLDKDSQQILAIRRNWKKDDDKFRARRRFVKYGYIPGLGFYDYGLVHLLGNDARALTALERLMIDAGQFGNFPGFLIAKGGGRQANATNEIRIPPGGAYVIDTANEDIRQSIMPLPYKEVSPTLMALAQHIEENAEQLGNTAEIPTGEGTANIPVGTVMAMIEQSTKVEGAVHKRNHRSQAEEFKLLKELFEEDPASLTAENDEPAQDWETEEAAAALSKRKLVPKADPNTPSQIHRIMRAWALTQLAQMNPELFNQREIADRVLTVIGVPDKDALFAPPMQAPPPDPKVMLDQQNLELKKEEQQRQAASQVLEAQQRQEDRQSQEKIAAMKEDTARINIAAKAQQHNADLTVDHTQHLQSAALDHAHHLDDMAPAMQPAPGVTP